MSRHRHTTETKRVVLEDYIAGLPVHAIAREHGVATETIRAWARQAGIGPRPGVIATCRGCSNVKRCYDDRMCATCLADIPLSGGRWVPRGGVQVWVAFPDRRRQPCEWADEIRAAS